MNFKCADPRLSYPVLKGLGIVLRDFSVPSKLTRTFLLYWGRIRFHRNEIYPFFVLLKLNLKHVLINASITQVKYSRGLYPPIFFKGNLFKTTGDVVINILKGFIYLKYVRQTPDLILQTIVFYFSNTIKPHLSGSALSVNFKYLGHGKLREQSSWFLRPKWKTFGVSWESIYFQFT